MKTRIGCTVKDYFAGKNDYVKASWSIEWSGFTVGNTYQIIDISQRNNLIIENDNGEIKEYSPVHFSPCI